MRMNGSSCIYRFIRYKPIIRSSSSSIPDTFSVGTLKHYVTVPTAGNIILRQTTVMSSRNNNTTFVKSPVIASPYLYQTIRSKTNWKLFVGGVGGDTNETSLREAFSAHGEVRKAKVVMNRKSGRPRGFAFVTFTEYESARSAIDTMDQWELHGRTVTVRWAKDSGGDLFVPSWEPKGHTDSDTDGEIVFIEPGKW